MVRAEEMRRAGGPKPNARADGQRIVMGNRRSEHRRECEKRKDRSGEQRGRIAQEPFKAARPVEGADSRPERGRLSGADCSGHCGYFGGGATL